MGREKRRVQPAAQKKEESIPIKEKLVLSPWSGPGVLASLPTARDIKIDKFSVSMHGTELIKDTLLELSHGRRYGLIGLNGTGKSVRAFRARVDLHPFFVPHDFYFYSPIASTDILDDVARPC